MPLLILVADDDPGIVTAIRDYLEMSGYGVIEAHNGAEALQKLERYHPHLLVSDIKMPEKTGYDLVKQIRQRPEFRLLPVILLTERKTTEDRIRGYQTGCDIYLPKPFELEELTAVIRNLLERSQIIQTELRFQQSGASAPLPFLSSPPEQSSSKAQKDIIVLDFTSREKEVLGLLSKGLSNAEIGNELHLSHRTIEKYISSLLRKTDTSNRTELISFAFERHLID